MKEIELLRKQLKKIKKSEEKFLNQMKIKTEKEKKNIIKDKIYDMVPEKLLKTLETTFIKGFWLVFEQGFSIIEKTISFDDLKEEYERNQFSLQRNLSAKNLRRFHKQAQKGVYFNQALTVVEGTTLGLLGIGLPDIPVFIAVLLKSIYEIGISYGFSYESDEEKQYALSILSAASCKAEDFLQYMLQTDSIGQNIDNHIPLDTTLSDQVEHTAQLLSENLLLAKVIQGLPIVGAVGGIFNLSMVSKVNKIAKLKYQKRFYYIECQKCNWKAGD